jgi:hypothetical protein
LCSAVEGIVKAPENRAPKPVTDALQRLLAVVWRVDERDVPAVKAAVSRLTSDDRQADIRLLSRYVDDRASACTVLGASEVIGAWVPREEIICKMCGVRTAADHSFCSACGAFLEWDGESVLVEGGPPADTTATTAIDEANGPAATAERPPRPSHPGATSSGSRVSPIRRRQPGDAFCGKCGQPNGPERRFCRRCGATLLNISISNVTSGLQRRVDTAIESAVLEGRLVWNPPDQMSYRKPTDVVVRVAASRDLDEKLEWGLKSGTPRFEYLLVSPFMDVELGGDGFEISHIGSTGQVLRSGEYRTWEFGVKPVRWGTLTLKLAVTLRIPIAGRPDDEKISIEALKSNVVVHVAAPKRMALTAAKNWKLVLATVTCGAGLGTGIAAWKGVF